MLPLPNLEGRISGLYVDSLIETNCFPRVVLGLQVSNAYEFQTQSTSHGGRGSIGVVIFSNHLARPSYASMECAMRLEPAILLYIIQSVYFVELSRNLRFTQSC